MCCVMTRSSKCHWQFDMRITKLQWVGRAIKFWPVDRLHRLAEFEIAITTLVFYNQPKSGKSLALLDEMDIEPEDSTFQAVFGEYKWLRIIIVQNPRPWSRYWVKVFEHSWSLLLLQRFTFLFMVLSFSGSLDQDPLDLKQLDEYLCNEEKHTELWVVCVYLVDWKCFVGHLQIQ